jgi:hypothetical protein
MVLSHTWHSRNSRRIRSHMRCAVWRCCLRGAFRSASKIPSTNAVALASAVARKFNSNLTLLHVIDASDPFGYGALSSIRSYGTDPQTWNSKMKMRSPDSQSLLRRITRESGPRIRQARSGDHPIRFPAQHRFTADAHTRVRRLQAPAVGLGHERGIARGTLPCLDRNTHRAILR